VRIFYQTSDLVRISVLVVSLVTTEVVGQGLLVDQASGTTDEVVQNSSIIPIRQIAQSFTPSLSAVGWVQFSLYTFTSSGDFLVINLRQGAWNGPIVSSTTPVVFSPGPIQKATFYFPDNIAVTPGQLYFFEPVLQSAGPMFIGYKFPSSYPGGEAWNNGLSSGDTSDYWFREGIVVPEPSIVALFGVGAGWILIRRKRRTDRRVEAGPNGWNERAVLNGAGNRCSQKAPDTYLPGRFAGITHCLFQ